MDGEVKGFGCTSNKNNTGSTSLSPSSCDYLIQSHELGLKIDTGK